MRIKLTALIATCAALAVSAVAQAGPVTVALFSFASQAEVDGFVKAPGPKCKRTLGGNATMQIAVREGSSCTYRSPVVADSSDVHPDQEISAAASLGARTPKNLQKKAFVGLTVRESDSAGWELRVRPFAQTWQLFRDPKGNAGPTLFRSGKGKFIRVGAKPNDLALRAFDFGSPNTSLVARVNGKAVATATDSDAGSPDGRRNGVVAGVKGAGAGVGVVGVFDNVAIKVPNPF